MRRCIALVVALVVLLAPALPAHDLFLKLTSYFLTPRQRVTVPVLNGTFTTSENAITRDRLRDISLVSGGTRIRIDTSAWRSSPDGKSSRVTIEVGAPGTYVLGASTLPRQLKMSAKDFNAYLEEEGLTDVLADRAKAGERQDSVSERYAKHVKAIFQVGDTRTNDFSKAMGYPAEIVPQENPYSLTAGNELTVKCMLAGWPAADVAVIAGGHTANGTRIAEQKVRSGPDGVARVKLIESGAWFVKFIRMERRRGDSVDYQSTWATLTFAVR